MVRTLAMAAGLALGASAAQAAFTGVAMIEGDSAAASAAIGMTATTFQIYALFDGPGDGQANTLVSSSFANITANEGLSFFNNTMFGNHQPPNSAFFPLVPTLQYDSYGTVGVATNDMPGGGAVSLEENTSITSDAIVGGWFNSSPPNAIGAAQDLGNGLFGTLMFNITVLGEVDVEGAGFTIIANAVPGSTSPGEVLPNSTTTVLNAFLTGSVQFFQQGEVGPVTHTVNFVPTPGALALFGVAGLAATRRRR